MRYLLLLLLSATLSGCASTSATQISRNQVIISASAAPAYGRAGAARVASQMAAVETIRNGFERYIIRSAAGQSNVGVVTTGPTGATTTGTFNSFGGTTTGQTHTTFHGSHVIPFGTHDSELMVLMLNPGDQGYDQGVDARRVLGTNWEQIVQQGVRTCT